ncbi:ABC transporter permease [Frigoriglobus tundricola]|uniref:ABC transporter permease subunit n=1 Tax=Frigoriglobus tundricola TaxID=2774151 RepID=A0A6M5YLZ4_9BACT|nr:ABC transporter permease [Frigoriglobus tundricola]QJW94945.1 ABC transporter permease subunit [Frigoriglobus tundricola]
MKRRRSLSRLLGNVLGLGTLLLLLWPLAYAVWISFTPSELLEPPRGELSLRWYRRFFESPQWTAGLWNSLKVAGLAVAGSLVGGTGLAVAVARYHFRGRRLLSGAVLLPLFVPTVVLGMGLLPWVRVLGLWGSLWSLAAGHGLWSLPVVFLVVRSALEELDPSLEAAARGLGASPLLTFRRVTLPLIMPAVLSGAAMGFVLSLNEFMIALFLATPDTETLPKVIWPNLRYTLTPLVAAASCVTMLLTLLGLVLAASLLRVEGFVDRLLSRGK